MGGGGFAGFGSGGVACVRGVERGWRIQKKPLPLLLWSGEDTKSGDHAALMNSH